MVDQDHVFGDRREIVGNNAELGFPTILGGCTGANGDDCGGRRPVGLAREEHEVVEAATRQGLEYVAMLLGDVGHGINSRPVGNGKSVVALRCLRHRTLLSGLVEEEQGTRPYCDRWLRRVTVAMAGIARKGTDSRIGRITIGDSDVPERHRRADGRIQGISGNVRRRGWGAMRDSLEGDQRYAGSMGWASHA